MIGPVPGANVACGGGLVGSVAEGRGGLVTDPCPQRDRALELGAADERFWAELLGVEADRADVVPPAGGLVALDQLSQRRAAPPRGAHGGGPRGGAPGVLC